MGQHLRRALDRDLLIIASSATANGPGTPPAEQRLDTLDSALAAASSSPVLLDLRTAKPAAVAAWLARDQSICTHFITKSIFTPGTSINVVVFIGCLTPYSADAEADSCD